MPCDYHWCPAPKYAAGQKNKHMGSVVTPSLTQDHHHNYHCALTKRYYPVVYNDDGKAEIQCPCLCTVDIHKSWTGLGHAKLHQEKVRKGGRESNAQHQAHMNSRHARVVAVPRPEPVSPRLPVLPDDDDDDPDNSAPPPPPRRRRQVKARPDPVASSDDERYYAPPARPPKTPIRQRPHESPKPPHMGGHYSDEDELYTTPHGTRRQIRRRVAPEIGTRDNPWDLSTPVAKVKAEPLTPKELALNRTPAYLRNIGISDTPPPMYGSWIPPMADFTKAFTTIQANTPTYRSKPKMQNVQDWRLSLQPSKIREVSHIQMDDVDCERGKFFLLPEISVGEEAWMGSQSSDGGDQTAAEGMDDPLVVPIAFEVEAAGRGQRWRPPYQARPQLPEIQVREFAHRGGFFSFAAFTTFVNPRPKLLKQLALSGPVPGSNSVSEENGTGKRAGRRHEGEERAKKKTRNEKAFDMEKLADALQRLGEDDLLKVVQIEAREEPDQEWIEARKR
ncbi:hypothetical protein FN846DRAFT_887316 [Sphaerosporella brunnea]|uniref:Uncharacterized protein n=1 Tax=Sphaerosporella brunnea TaxID=1250544 RepID=A0A5J5F645_9PEZI|nr:hypothetical protein FN846DRAFT_887316 [Sphaerosporella brunnea]